MMQRDEAVSEQVASTRAFPRHELIYGLETNTTKPPLPAHQPLEPSSQKLLVLAYNEDGALLVRSGSDGQLELPLITFGGRETHAVENVGTTFAAMRLGICDVTPLQIHGGDDTSMTLVFRLRVPPSTPLGYDRDWEWCYSVPVTWPVELRELVQSAADQLPPLDEIAVNEVLEQSARRWEYEWVHRRLVRPVLGRAASDALRSLVMRLLGPDGPAVDFACGDDFTILEWARSSARTATTDGDEDALFREGRFALANDVALVASAPTRAVGSSNVFFCSHDLRHLPVKHRFRVGLLKNTLHHLPSPEAQRRLLNGLLERYVDRLVVVEIRDPEEGGWRARLWNAYYRWVLGDEGDVFLGDHQFRRVVEDTHQLIEMGEIQTSRGPYMWATLGAALPEERS